MVAEKMRNVVGRGVRLKKGELWQLYWLGNKMKTIANIILCEKGPVRWERRWERRWPSVGGRRRRR